MYGISKMKAKYIYVHLDEQELKQSTYVMNKKLHKKYTEELQRIQNRIIETNYRVQLDCRGCRCLSIGKVEQN